MGTILRRRKFLDELVSAEECQAKFKDLIESYQQLFDQPLTDDQIAFLQSDVRELAIHVNDRIGYWEERRTLFLQIGLGMLGFALAGLGAVVILFDKMLVLSNVFVAGFTLLLTFMALTVAGLCILWLWNAQNNPSYPFAKVATTWRWQYRYAEPEKSKVQVWVEPPSRSEFDETMRVYLQNLIDYSKKTLALDRKGALEQDLGQLFLLIINEKYKIKFVNMLRDRFWTCLNCTLGVFSIALVFSILFVIFGWYRYFFQG
ncbi:MAG: hypothetical protein MUP04_09405 [Anaerolineae bacterium]|nr:hypothetical protein [Anaerolineae bacterium]